MRSALEEILQAEILLSTPQNSLPLTIPVNNYQVSTIQKFWTALSRSIVVTLSIDHVSLEEMKFSSEMSKHTLHSTWFSLPRTHIATQRPNFDSVRAASMV